MSLNENGSGNSKNMNLSNDNKRNNTEHNIDEINKDKKIIELRTKLFKLKKREKDYDSLNQKYQQLVKDFSSLNEANFRLEYEIKQREIEYNRRISDIKGENEILKLGLNDKATSSKKIVTENDLLERQIILKDQEIKELNEKLSDLSCHLDHTDEKRNELLKMVNDLEYSTMNQNEQIFKLNQDNICLAKICQDNEKSIIFGEKDIDKLSRKINENRYEMEKLNEKILYHEKNINNLKYKLNNYNDLNLNLQNDIENYRKKYNCWRNENDRLKYDLINQRTLINESECQNEKLNNLLIEKERQISQIYNDNENLRVMNTDCNNNSDYYKKENQKLENQIRMLEKQNEEIMKIIDNILEQKRKNKDISVKDDNGDYRSFDNLNNCFNEAHNKFDSNNFKPSCNIYTYQLGDF